MKQWPGIATKLLPKISKLLQAIALTNNMPSYDAIARKTRQAPKIESPK